MTSSTQKESRQSGERNQRGTVVDKHINSREESMSKLVDSTGTVVNSIQYNYSIKPSYRQ